VVVARVTGISEDTVGRGIKELRAGVRLEPGQVGRRGAGRPALTVSDPTLLEDLQGLVDPDTRGDPCSPLRWTSKSLAKLAVALVAAGHEVSDRSVGKL
jgi:Rhodopirellula transposase DDE domain